MELLYHKRQTSYILVCFSQSIVSWFLFCFCFFFVCFLCLFFSIFLCWFYTLQKLRYFLLVLCKWIINMHFTRLCFETRKEWERNRNDLTWFSFHQIPFFSFLFFVFFTSFLTDFAYILFIFLIKMLFYLCWKHSPKIELYEYTCGVF